MCSSREFRSDSCCCCSGYITRRGQESIADPSEKVSTWIKFQAGDILNASANSIICKTKGRKWNERSDSQIQSPVMCILHLPIWESKWTVLDRPFNVCIHWLLQGWTKHHAKFNRGQFRFWNSQTSVWSLSERWRLSILTLSGEKIHILQDLRFSEKGR